MPPTRKNDFITAMCYHFFKINSVQKLNPDYALFIQEKHPGKISYKNINEKYFEAT